MAKNGIININVLKGKQTKNLYTCEATNDSDSEELDRGEVEDSPQYFSESNSENISQVSLSAMTRISQPQTLKLKGHVKREM